MVKPNRLENKDYTEILRIILRDNPPLKDFQHILQVGQSTANEKIHYLVNKGIIYLNRLPGYNRKIPLISYSGSAKFMFNHFLKKELMEYNKLKLKNKLPPINYESEIIATLLEDHFQNELIEKKNEIGIKELFERFILNMGNNAITSLKIFPGFRKAHNKAKEKGKEEEFQEMNEETTFFNEYMRQIEFENIPKMMKFEEFKENIEEFQNEEDVDVIIPLSILCLKYACKINKTNIKELLLNFYPENIKKKYKKQFESVYGKI